MDVVEKSEIQLMIMNIVYFSKIYTPKILVCLWDEFSSCIKLHVLRHHGEVFRPP